ncbi:MAG: beta-ketoacyl synthase N-terminal-like domain-containing protein [Bacteroidales bacterium]|jgi:3-oxoacyl-[acyl-carrier-protein] synthase-1|nr:beta-ketoacyl synthase N-terminal-like domain-containing protein [Bacteroidales bacterium]
MNTVYTLSDNIITSLGFSSRENFDALKKGVSGIKETTDPEITQVPLNVSRVDSERLRDKFSRIGNPAEFTRLEQLMILSILDALSQTTIDASSGDTLFIFSSTKGNIDLLEKNNLLLGEDRVHLWKLGEVIGTFFNTKHPPLIISNACVSGLTGIIAGAHYLKKGKYKHAIVCGGDILSEFTPSGFQSFKAISPQPCRPFDAHRDGITLGEGAGTIILSNDKKYIQEKNPVIFRGGANTNDANHISGPSRTGDGLYYAIRNALTEANKNDRHVDYISGHGTATPYNDEMESKAIAWAGLDHVPVNSLKAYWGHTLGAAGIVESIAGINSIKENCLIKTKGYAEHGVSKPLNIITEYQEKEIRNFLKTASGFGGSNAAAYFSELNNE